MHRPFRRQIPKGYEPPKIDGPKARANAITLITGARDLERITPEILSRQYRLKPETAARLLADEQARREQLL